MIFFFKENQNIFWSFRRKLCTGISVVRAEV